MKMIRRSSEKMTNVKDTTTNVRTAEGEGLVRL